MPDWSYHPLKKCVLDKLRPKTSREFIHKSMNTIASIPGGRNLIAFLGHMKPPQQFHREFLHTVFPSPIGLSGQTDPRLSGMKAFQELGFGFLEIGPIVLNEPIKQRAPKWEQNRLLFSNHPEKVSLKFAISKLTKNILHIPVIARIDAHVNRTEWDIIVQQLTPFVDAFIGTSDQVYSYLDGESVLGRSFFITISADEVEKEEFILRRLTQYPSVLGIAIAAPRHQRNDGYWHEVENANTLIGTAVKHLKEMYPAIMVITSGGVETPEDGYSLVHSGSDLLLLTDGYVRAGPGLPKRIHERLLFDEERLMKKQHWYWSFLFGLGIVFGGIIALYFAFTSIILPYDESFIGLTKADLQLVNPLIIAFMSHDRMALAGTMISGGILYIQLARHGIRNGMHWAKITFHSAAIFGFLGIFLFIGFGYFDWLHGLFWLLLVPIYYKSVREGIKVAGSPYSRHGENDKEWKIALYGQLMLIILGFSIVIGGIVISTIGVSKVFVSTDLSFLCMTPQMLEIISNKLIPVIAHDRAGFGSALISVGLLVLMLSLWGFRKGEQWIWNTLCIGALPAFIAGIGTHFYIGYTTFIHLLPVYFLVLLYLLGLGLSYPFLKKGS